MSSRIVKLRNHCLEVVASSASLIELTGLTQLLAVELKIELAVDSQDDESPGKSSDLKCNKI